MGEHRQHMPEMNRTSFDALGQSEAFVAFQERLSRVARVDRPVLLIGERGTGKELAAARLHYLSLRWQEPLIALNCSALSPTLIESELFGHEAGAFTGATGRRKGRFEAADGGTLFLDEIGTIPLEVQEKILRVVEYGQFERVGGSDPIRVNVRIVGATNADLRAMALAGQFKEDLLDRLSFEVLHLPPLRVRDEDIMLLAHHFAARMAHELGRLETPEFTLQAREILEHYSWPGNVRELKNVVERAVYLSDTHLVDTIVFDPFASPYQHACEEQPSVDEMSSGGGEMAVQTLADAVRDLEIRRIRDALERTRFNQQKAADLLGITYHQFRGMYRKYRVQLGL